MARRSKSAISDPVDVVKISSTSTYPPRWKPASELSYSVIYSRALPDAPRRPQARLQRRILYMMQQMGLRPDKGHVRAPRVMTGEVMGKLTRTATPPSDAMVRLAQSFALRLPR